MLFTIIIKSIIHSFQAHHAHHDYNPLSAPPKKQKEQFSLILIPVVYFLFRTILYSETQIEYIAGTISIFLASVVIYALRIKVEEQEKGRSPELVFYAYYPFYLFLIHIILS